MAIKIALLFSGLYLLTGLLTGVWKYLLIMKSDDHRAPVYVDIAHRNALLFSFACLVIAKLIEFSPFSTRIQLVITVIPLFFFALTTINQIKEGALNRTNTIFKERNFSTTWFMYALIVGEVGAVSLMIVGFIYTQFLIG